MAAPQAIVFAGVLPDGRPVYAGFDTPGKPKIPAPPATASETKKLGLHLAWGEGRACIVGGGAQDNSAFAERARELAET